MRQIALAVLAVFVVAPPVSGQSGRARSTLEQAIVQEHNLARQNPRAYADYLEALLPLFDGNVLHLPGEIGLRTHEGPRAVAEAIRFLRDIAPAGPVQLSDGMSYGADDHVRDSAAKGRVSHEGTDGSQAWDRVSRYGTWHESIAENLAFGQYQPDDARWVVMQLLIDDGVDDRGHRTNIFNPAYTTVGVSCGPHRDFGGMCVIVYAGGYVERGSWEQGAGGREQW